MIQYRNNDKGNQANEEDALVRRVLIEECMHGKTIAGRRVYVAHWGNPSGSSLTSYFNTFVNMVYLRLEFTRAMRLKCPTAPFSEYDRFVRDRLYGDDGVVTIRRSSPVSFQNVVTEIRKMGVTIGHPTVANALPCEGSITDIVILKRRFAITPIALGQYRPQLDKTSIIEMNVGL